MGSTIIISIQKLTMNIVKLSVRISEVLDYQSWISEGPLYTSQICRVEYGEVFHE